MNNFLEKLRFELPLIPRKWWGWWVPSDNIWEHNDILKRWLSLKVIEKFGRAFQEEFY